MKKLLVTGGNGLVGSAINADIKIGREFDLTKQSDSDNAFNLYKPTSQTGEVGEYSIDLAKDRYEYNGFVHEVNIAWITFRHN